MLRRFRPRLRNARKFGNGGCKSSGTTAMPRHCSIYYLSNKAPRLWLASHGKGSLSRRVVHAPQRGGKDVVGIHAGRSTHFRANEASGSEFPIDPSVLFGSILKLCDAHSDYSRSIARVGHSKFLSGY